MFAYCSCTQDLRRQPFHFGGLARNRAVNATELQRFISLDAIAFGAAFHFSSAADSFFLSERIS
jgi:hypothetical protein